MPEQHEDEAHRNELELARKIAAEWSEVPVDRLVAVLSVLEPKLVREHELRVQQEAHRHEIELAKLRDRQEARRQRHAQERIGIASGLLISLTCFGGAIWFGIQGRYWAMGILVGPVLLALTKIFVLRRSDDEDMAAVAETVGRLRRKAIDAGPGTEAST